MAKGNRTWTLPPEDELPEGWVPDTGQPIAEIREQGPAGYEALVQEMVNAAWVLYRFGGIFSAAAGRREIAPGIYASDGYVLTWDSFGPTKRLHAEKPKAEAPEPAPEPEIPMAPVPEPVERPERTAPASPEGGGRSVPPSPTLAADGEDEVETAIPETPIEELADVFGG